MDSCAPVFLTSADVVGCHDGENAVSSGRLGIRDQNALESAVAQPRQIHAFEQGDLVDMASAYLYSIAMNHACADGNKRAGYVSCLTFLALNGIELGAPVTLEVALLAAANNNLLDKRGLTGILRQLTILPETDPAYYASAHYREVRGRPTPGHSHEAID